MTKRDEWVRVKSNDELRAGMCLELRTCMTCGENHRFILLSRETRPTKCISEHRRCKGWEITASGDCDESGMFCGRPVSVCEGRLYRLSDSALTDSEETRELERAR